MILNSYLPEPSSAREAEFDESDDQFSRALRRQRSSAVESIPAIFRARVCKTSTERTSTCRWALPAVFENWSSVAAPERVTWQRQFWSPPRKTRKVRRWSRFFGHHGAGHHAPSPMFFSMDASHLLRPGFGTAFIECRCCAIQCAAGGITALTSRPWRPTGASPRLTVDLVLVTSS